MDTPLLSEEKTILKLRTLYRRYGYLPYKMNRFEEYDLYVRNKDFLISDNVITFTDTSGKLMALKPDVTLSIVKNSKDDKGLVQKLCYNEYVCRPAGAGKSIRETMQAGLECIGDLDTYCRAEVLRLAVESLQEISSTSVLLVSHLGIIGSVLGKLQVSEDARRRIIKCMQEKNVHDAEKICADESVSPEIITVLSAVMQASGVPAEVFPVLKKVLPGNAEVAAFEEILQVLPADAVRIDFSLVNDMHYYNGLVFQGFVAGVASAVLSGGEYDLLMKKMGRKSMALGFAVYLDKLEKIAAETPEYDFDTLVLYDEWTKPAAVAATIAELQAAGKTASAQKKVPEFLRYGEIVHLEGGKKIC